MNAIVRGPSKSRWIVRPVVLVGELLGPHRRLDEPAGPAAYATAPAPGRRAQLLVVVAAVEEVGGGHEPAYVGLGRRDRSPGTAGTADRWPARRGSGARSAAQTGAAGGLRPAGGRAAAQGGGGPVGAGSRRQAADPRRRGHRRCACTAWGQPAAASRSWATAAPTARRGVERSASWSRERRCSASGGRRPAPAADGRGLQLVGGVDAGRWSLHGQGCVGALLRGDGVTTRRSTSRASALWAGAPTRPQRPRSFERALDGAVEGQVGEVHPPQGLDRQCARARRRRAGRAPRRRTGATAVAPTRMPRVGVGDDLDDARRCRRRGSSLGWTVSIARQRRPRRSSPASRACASVSPTAPTSGSVKVTRRDRAVLRPGSVLAEQVAHRGDGLVARDVGVSALAGDVADRPEPLAGAHPLVGRRATSASGSSPTVSRPMSSRFVRAAGRRPAARLGSRRRPVPRRTCEGAVVVDAGDVDAGAHVDAVGQRARASITALVSGSSGPMIRSATSIRVTSTPKRAKVWASSQPIGPPPMTTRLSGSSVRRTTSRLVQNGVSASPSIGRTPGRVPVLSTTPRRATHLDLPSAAVDHDPTGSVEAAGAAHDPHPRLLEPLDVAVVVPVVGGLRAPGRPRCASRAAPAAVPPSPSTRRASASTSAARIISFEGVQPKNGHSPPTSCSSTPMTSRPALAELAGGVLAARTEADDNDVDGVAGRCGHRVSQPDRA